MQVTVTDAGTLAKNIVITVTAAEIAERKTNLIKRISGNVRMPGFRPGKANTSLIERRHGAEAQAQAEQELADEGIRDAVAKQQLRPFGQFSTDKIERENGLRIALSCEVFPDVAVPDAKSFAIDASASAVSDSEIEDTIKSIANSLGSYGPVPADETIKADDAVVLTGSVTVGGKEAKKLHDFNHLVGGYPLFGKPAAEVITAFAKVKIGSEIRFDTELPAQFSPEEFAGKKATVSATVQSAQRTLPKPIDDELAKQVGLDSLAQLRERMRERISNRKESEQRGKQLEQLNEQLLAKVKVDVPPKALAAAIENATKAAADSAKPEEKDAKVAEAKSSVEKGLKRYIILSAIAREMNVEVTNDDFRDQIMLAAQQTGRRPQDIADQLKKSDRMNQVAMEIREAKAAELFLDKVLGKSTAAAKA